MHNDSVIRRPKHNLESVAEIEVNITINFEFRQVHIHFNVKLAPQ